MPPGIFWRDWRSDEVCGAACLHVFHLEALMLSSRLVLVSALALLASACGGYSSSSPSPVQSPGPTGDPSTAITIPRGADILGTRAFNPDELNVTAGATVTWTNTDAIAHTSTSDGSGWNSGNVAPGGQFSTTFPNAGTFRYHCSIHPSMVGTVIVH
jgi:plastocyanin